MVKTSYVPERGDFIYLEFDPQVGHEQSGRRPALVISPKAYNRKSGLCIVAPITNKDKGYPYDVKILSSIVTGVILSDQIKSLDWKMRKAQFIIKAKEEIMDEVIGVLSTLIS